MKYVMDKICHRIQYEIFMHKHDITSMFQIYLCEEDDVVNENMNK